LVVTVPAVTGNVVLMLPTGTVTDAGAVTSGLLLESDMTVLPATAAPDSPRVQVLTLPEVSEDGEHTREDTVGRPELTVIVPPVPETAYALALESEPRGLNILIVDVLIDGDIVKVAVATTPLASVLALTPARIQVFEPAAPEQVTVLPAAAAAAPGETTKLTMSEAA
jgi:hypothetical protein